MWFVLSPTIPSQVKPTQPTCKMNVSAKIYLVDDSDFTLPIYYISTNFLSSAGQRQWSRAHHHHQKPKRRWWRRNGPFLSPITKPATFRCCVIVMSLWTVKKWVFECRMDEELCTVTRNWNKVMECLGWLTDWLVGSTNNIVFGKEESLHCDGFHGWRVP